MNYTNSGIKAEGAPSSRVRANNEVRMAQGGNSYNHHILLLTDEGINIVDRFLSAKGCSPSEMSLNGKAEFIAKEEFLFDFFLTGVRYGLEK